MIQVGDAIWQWLRWRGLVQSRSRARCGWWELQKSSYSRSTIIRWRPPPGHPRQGHRHPGRAAQRPAGPADGRHQRLRRHRPLPGRGVDVLNEQARTLQGQVEAHFGRHPAAEIYRSQPGLGPVPGARVPGESGDDPDRYASGKARKNTRHQPHHPCLRKQEDRRRPVHPQQPAHRRAHGPGLRCLGAPAGAGALYDAERASGTGHNPPCAKLASRLAGILHRCLKTRTVYDEATAWPHRDKTPQSDIAA